jgi:hypothetical protein
MTEEFFTFYVCPPIVFIMSFIIFMLGNKEIVFYKRIIAGLLISSLLCFPYISLAIFTLACVCVFIFLLALFIEWIEG